MKKLTRYFSILTVVASLAAAPALFAGECCTKAKDAAKKGEACEKCTTGCCKDAAKEVAKADKEAKKEAKVCAKCAAKAADKKS